MNPPAPARAARQPGGETAIVDALIGRARAAMRVFADADQARVDEAVTALAWSIYKPENARMLAELAVKDTGLGNVDSKITKNQRKTFGCLRDLLRARTVGVIEEDKAKGIVKYAKPVGVVAAVAPSTNPAATPVNKAMFAVKGRNAVIIAPSPAGQATTGRTVDLMRQELQKIGLPADLVQVLPAPVDKALTQALMEAADLVVVTGSQNNVRRAYSSGTPAIGVGAGNVPVIIDSSADLKDAAEKITKSKIFDNSTSCSSENSVIVMADVYDAAIRELQKAGGYLATAAEKQKIKDTLWVDGHLNRHVIAKDAAVLADVAGLAAEAHKAKFFMVEDENP
ncbi:MAG TPA: aldehyde dehydrogenase family protein, partial [Rhodospirillales bacterium]